MDPSCRPGIIRDPDRYRARLRRILASGGVLNVSDEDVAWLLPGIGGVQAVRSMLDAGPRIGVLTRGEHGAVVITADDAVTVPRVDVVDTIGAGDAFGGALVAWYQSRGLGTEDLRDLDAAVEAARFACAVAAQTCARGRVDASAAGEEGP